MNHFFVVANSDKESVQTKLNEIVTYLKAKGKTLDKSDREFYRENRRLVDLNKPMTEEENDTINAWLGKKTPDAK